MIGVGRGRWRVPRAGDPEPKAGVRLALSSTFSAEGSEAGCTA